MPMLPGPRGPRNPPAGRGEESHGEGEKDGRPAAYVDGVPVEQCEGFYEEMGKGLVAILIEAEAAHPNQNHQSKPPDYYRDGQLRHFILTVTLLPAERATPSPY